MTTPTYNYGGSVPRAYQAAGTIAVGELCMLDTSGNVLVTSAITSDVEGVAITPASSGDMVTLQQAGVAKVKTSAAVTAGDQVMPGANGKAATSSGATAKSFGKALTTDAADGEFIAVRLALGVNGPANA